MVKPPNKMAGISDNFQFIWQKLCYNIPLAWLLQKHVGLRDSSAKYQKSFLHKMCFMVMLRKCTFYRNNNLSTTCHCRQLKLNLLSAQINICLMTNQTHALLVQRALWMRAAVMLLQSLYFSPPPSRAIIPDACPLSEHLKIKMAAINGKTRYISAIS